jgi:molybdopterin converting factor small subunit
VSVKINIPLLYRHVTGGLSAVEVEGTTVEGCLKSLIKRFPGMKGVLFDKKERVLNGIEIYLNHKSAYPDELVKTVKDGDEISITLVIAGG